MQTLIIFKLIVPRFFASSRYFAVLFGTLDYFHHGLINCLKIRWYKMNIVWCLITIVTSRQRCSVIFFNYHLNHNEKLFYVWFICLFYLNSQNSSLNASLLIMSMRWSLTTSWKFTSWAHFWKPLSDLKTDTSLVNFSNDSIMHKLM